MAIGTEAQKINSGKYTLWVRNAADNAEDEWIELQNKRLVLSHAEIREPTTSGGVVYYSGAPDNILTGTLLFTRDLWNDSTYGLTALLTTSNGEYTTRKLKFRLTDSAGTAMTFTQNCKITVVDINAGAEGGTKVDVSFIMIGNPTVA